MKLRLILAAIVTGILLLAAAGSAHARCYSFCAGGMNCTMQCYELPDITFEG